MDKWTSCQYDDSLNLIGVTIIEGGFNTRQQAVRRSHEYEKDHKSGAAIEVEGGAENCPIHLVVQDVEQHHHLVRGK